MSAKKAGMIGLVLLLMGLVMAFYAWLSPFGMRREATVSHTAPAHQPPKPSAQTQAVTGGGARPGDRESGQTATYHNVRFDFAVTYPRDLLVAGQEADNGDGLQFASQIDDADIRAYGSYNALEQSSAQMLRFNTKDDCMADKITYRVSKPSLVAYSCLSPKGRVVYEKVIIRADTLATVRFEYSPDKQARWAPVIKQMADSLRLGPGPAYDQAR